MSSTQPAIVTIGNFDGVHLGHQELMRQVADRARALGLGSLAVTFAPHPEQVLFPERRLTHLSTPAERVELIHGCGIDHVWVCPFTIEIARLEPADFMRMVADRQPIAELWVGADFALGRGRRGSISVLSEIGSARGWGLHVVPPYMLEGQVVSSTAIRTLLAAGAVRGATALLGHAYRVSGEIEDDELVVDPLCTLPQPSTYDVELRQDDTTSEVSATVAAGRIHLNDPRVPHHAGPASIDFLRRSD